MRVVVSNALEDKFVNFVVVPNFKKVTELVGVDIVIIHKFDETDFDAGVFISDLNKSGDKKFVYINDSPTSAMKMLMNGVGGFCFEDEFYLEDEDELVALIEDLDSTAGQQLALAAPALSVLDDFVGGFSRGEDRVKAPIYLAKVKEAVNELSVLTQEQQIQLTTMGESAIEVFQKASQIIRNMNSTNEMIRQKLADLENGMSNASEKSMFSNNIMFFAPYTYRSNAKLLLIREYAPCRYLTSFVLGYLHHLHYELNRRPKLVFVIQKGAGVMAKYEGEEWPIITQDNMNLATLYDGEIVVTNNPKKEVMKELTSKPNDVFVIVDRLYGSMDIVSGRVVKVNAIGSRSDVARYKVKPEETIFPVTRQPKQLFDIPVIKSFPVDIEARYAMYNQVMSDRYSMLDAKIGLKVGE